MVKAAIHSMAKAQSSTAWLKQPSTAWQK